MEIEKKDKKRFVRYLPYILAILVLVSGFSCCGSQQQGQEEQQVVHVAVSGSDEAGTGTQDAPYATVSAASEAAPEAIIVVHEGEYGPIKLGPECSGSENAPTVIRPAEGDKVVIHGEDGTGISLVNVSHVTVEGLEVEGGTHGIYYESTRKAGESLADICIRDCTVHGVRGTQGCEVYDCECGSSESVVLNGNVDGFTIENNIIHDNNNIGIDMIGFEGTAKHPDEDSGNNPYEADMVRNGVCTGNVVYNISTEGNKAYLEDGEYDPCAGGIYVDGGQNIEIYNNFIFNCDIGLEVATEHSPDDNELFRIAGVRVHDNVIADCTGFIGICFGGYDKDLGFTEECIFEHNTLVDNVSQIGVQRSRDNRISANLIVGGETAVEFSEECRKKDMINDISGNVFCGIENEESWTVEYGKMYENRTEVIEGFRSLIDGTGSIFVPDGDLMELYNEQNHR